MQFGINKHKQIFKDYKKLHEPVGWVQFEVFQKFVVATSYFNFTTDWIKIWHVNSSVKIHSLSPSHVWKLSSFFKLWKAVCTHSWILKNLTAKQTKISLACGLHAAFFSNVFRVVEKLQTVFTPRRNHSTQHKLLKPKHRETKLKSTRKLIFWALKDIYELLLVATWLKLLHWTLNRLDLPPEVFTVFCLERTFLISQPFQFFRKSTILHFSPSN